jgi:hypothetical protein
MIPDSEDTPALLRADEAIKLFGLKPEQLKQLKPAGTYYPPGQHPVQLYAAGDVRRLAERSPSSE